MIRSLIKLIILLGSIHSANCNLHDRLVAGTRACKWMPWSKNFDIIYDNLEEELRKKKAPVEDSDKLYAFISAEIVQGEIDNCIPARRINELKSALTQLYMTKDLHRRDCLDHCTYILAKHNCEIGYHKHACLPRSREKSYIKSIIDRNVFPLIERCQIPLWERALGLNTTLIPVKLHASVTLLADEIAGFRPTRLWNSFEDMILVSTKPNFLIRRMILRNKNEFFENILSVMCRLERQIKEYGLNSEITLRSLTPKLAESYFQSLILNPCRKYIEIMHKIMDPAIFYGSIADMDRYRFNFTSEISDRRRVEYYRLVQRYYACMFFDEGEFNLDWTETIMKLFS